MINRKKYRDNHGLPRPRGIPRQINPHPNHGGSRGYDPTYRQNMLNNAAQNIPVEASSRTLQRYRVRINPLTSTGNKAFHKFNGRYLFLLCLYRMAYPKCNINELRRFLLEAHLNPFVVNLMRTYFNIQLVQPGLVFTKSDIIRAEKRLDMTLKRGSTTANQALTRQNRQRRFVFWNLQPMGLISPGIRGVPLLAFIDIDECAMFLEMVNRSYGKAYIGLPII